MRTFRRAGTTLHGPKVFRVCGSVLRDADDAEDASQATFLVLAHRARLIRRQGSVASGLFGVATRPTSAGCQPVALEQAMAIIHGASTSRRYDRVLPNRRIPTGSGGSVKDTLTEPR
jgi:hypothetical protein